MPKPKIPESALLESTKDLKESYNAIIALPSCNEASTLPEVISSLEKNSSSFTEQTLIIINVNNRTSANNQDNLRTLNWLKALNSQLHIAWLNNAVEPHSFPEKFGVGLARHQAVCAGLKFINEYSPVISLDGDSPVNEDYLEEIFKAFDNGMQAGHVNFSHKQEGSPEEIRAIQLYDQHLHIHRKRLEEAGSPHAWYAIGSTIVCTKAAYNKAGGYNVRRMAGEDFYLLQQLSKTGHKIEMIKNAYVYPSNRASDRVPFGTGKAVGDILETGDWFTYNPQCYTELKTLLSSVKENLKNGAEDIFEAVSDQTKEYLESRKFTEAWKKLQNNSRDEKMLQQRFHEWLDAFQTLKLIHHLTDSRFPKEKIQLP